MAKTFPCNICKTEYKVRKTNFSKDNRSKKNYRKDCKKCVSERAKKYLKELSPEKRLATRERRNASNKKYEQSQKYKDNYEKRKPRRRILRNLQNLKIRNAERLAVYIEKVNWKEAPYVISDIQSWEL